MPPWSSPGQMMRSQSLLLDGGFGVFDGEDAGELVVLDVDGGDGGEEGGLVGVGEEQDRLVGVVDVARRRGRGGPW